MATEFKRVVVAIDKFKGSLTARQAAEAVEAGLRRVWADADVVVVPIGDGGDGTLVAAADAGFEVVPVSCSGPTGLPVSTGWARRGGVAVVELADCCGLLRLPRDHSGAPKLDPFGSGTAGLGQVVAAAVESGDRDHPIECVVVGLGGSASTDGGAGLLGALGVRLTDADGNPIPAGLAGVQQVAAVDLSGLHPRLATGQVRLVMATDVDHPLLGERGAAAVFGPQKGLPDDQLVAADEALNRLADLVEQATGRRVRDQPGAGAAGGTGWALLSLGAVARPGIEVVLDFSDGRELIASADVVITGEGSLDEQTLAGKAPMGVAATAVRAGVPVVAISGRRTLTDAQLGAAGFTAAVALTELEPDLDRCRGEAARLVAEAAEQLAADLDRSGPLNASRDSAGDQRGVSGGNVT